MLVIVAARAALADNHGMCLTIPKKVISISGERVVVENPDGIGQEVKTIIDLKVGDFVLTQQNIVLEKIEKKEAEETIKMIFDIQNRKEKI